VLLTRPCHVRATSIFRYEQSRGVSALGCGARYDRSASGALDRDALMRRGAVASSHKNGNGCISAHLL
jgi:hypothetical protein